MPEKVMEVRGTEYKEKLFGEEVLVYDPGISIERKDGTFFLKVRTNEGTFIFKLNDIQFVCLILKLQRILSANVPERDIKKILGGTIIEIATYKGSNSLDIVVQKDGKVYELHINSPWFITIDDGGDEDS